MTVKFSTYQHETDYELVNTFLYQTYALKYPNWLQPRWEYFHYHPGTEVSSYPYIGVWKDSGRVVGLATHEGGLGEVFIMVEKGYEHLKSDILSYAEVNMKTTNKENKKELAVHVNEFDYDLMELVEKRNYKKHETYELICYLTDQVKDQDIVFPKEYNLKNLQGKADIEKFHEVMWRGFNHEGKAPLEGIEWREKMQSAPNYNYHLNVVLESKEGRYVAYSGIWVDPHNKVGYVEPVCTDPDYRKLGLGKAVVLECIRRAQALGAKTCYVGSKNPFYQKLGFKPLFKRLIYVKEFNDHE